MDGTQRRSAIFGRVRKIAGKKKTISFVMSVRPSPRKQLGSNWTDFHEILYLSIFRVLGGGTAGKIQVIKVSLKSDMNIGYFT